VSVVSGTISWSLLGWGRVYRVLYTHERHVVAGPSGECLLAAFRVGLSGEPVVGSVGRSIRDGHEIESSTCLWNAMLRGVEGAPFDAVASLLEQIFDVVDEPARIE